jgi:hypothetical protein
MNKYLMTLLGYLSLTLVLSAVAFFMLWGWGIPGSVSGGVAGGIFGMGVIQSLLAARRALPRSEPEKSRGGANLQPNAASGGQRRGTPRVPRV